jgi:hypothetical protein
MIGSSQKKAVDKRNKTSYSEYL